MMIWDTSSEVKVDPDRAARQALAQALTRPNGRGRSCGIARPEGRAYIARSEHRAHIAAT